MVTLIKPKHWKFLNNLFILNEKFVLKQTFNYKKKLKKLSIKYLPNYNAAV